VLPADAYTAWKANPSSSNLNATVRSLDGTINYALYAVGDTENPQLKHQARLFAADAVKTFDPAQGAQLPSWVSGQLQSLRRFKRENTGPVKVPERAQLDAWHLEKSRRDYLDKNGVEPDVKQLADASHLSVKRISDVRRATRPVVAQEAIGDVEQNLVDFTDEALEYVFDESDATDRKIIEHLTGYGGTPMLAKHVLAQQMGVSPSQITRRSDRIARKLQEMEQDLKEVVS
jgi:DNA-directed RNA polymerase specialized sigma subunit